MIAACIEIAVPLGDMGDMQSHSAMPQGDPRGTAHACKVVLVLVAGGLGAESACPKFPWTSFDRFSVMWQTQD